MTAGKCNGCGQIDHAGGCDLTEFFSYQRFGTPADRPPPPPTPLIASLTPGVDEAPPLSPRCDISLSLVEVPVFVDKSVDTRETLKEKKVRQLAIEVARKVKKAAYAREYQRRLRAQKVANGG